MDRRDDHPARLWVGPCICRPATLYSTARVSTGSWVAANRTRAVRCREVRNPTTAYTLLAAPVGQWSSWSAEGWLARLRAMKRDQSSRAAGTRHAPVVPVNESAGAAQRLLGGAEYVAYEAELLRLRRIRDRQL